MVYYFLIAESRRYNGRRTNSVDIGEIDIWHTVFTIHRSQKPMQLKYSNFSTAIKQKRWLRNKNNIKLPVFQATSSLQKKHNTTTFLLLFYFLNIQVFESFYSFKYKFWKYEIRNGTKL